MASCHLMHFEANLSEGFSSSCFEGKRVQVTTVTQLKTLKKKEY